MPRRAGRPGFRLAADDVGAGNAGLRLLSEIQFDIVKIDLSLVQGGVLHDPSFAVLRALQELAARWHATIVAEGVETVRAAGGDPQHRHHGRSGLSARPAARQRGVEPIDIEGLLPDDWDERADTGRLSSRHRSATLRSPGRLRARSRAVG